MWDSATNSAADPNTTIHIAGRSQVVAPGIQEWKNSSGSLLGSALFYVLPKLLSRKEVKRIRALVQDDPFDVDTDSVDGQWTHELYLESNGSFDNAARLVGKADALSPEVAAKRRALRRRRRSDHAENRPRAGGSTGESEIPAAVWAQCGTCLHTVPLACPTLPAGRAPVAWAAL